MAFRLQSPDTATAWTKDLTQDYLTHNPLPLGFKWPHRDYKHEDDGGLRDVKPSHKEVTAYGKWLRETPYFPGLFELIHEILMQSEDLGDAEWLASELLKHRPARRPMGQAAAEKSRAAAPGDGEDVPF